MSQLELVVARHREGLGWLRRIPGAFRTRVYDKSGETPPQGRPLANVGREAHTYLHHIVTHYDQLAPWTLFCQGHPFDHLPRFHERLRAIATGRENAATFEWIGFVIDEDDDAGERLFRPWAKNAVSRPLPMEPFWRALFATRCPRRFVFVPGGQFLVSRQQIRRRTVGFYRRARELAASMPEAAHCFERSWDRVFGIDGIPAPYRSWPRPIYFRPIKRLGLTWADVPASAPEAGPYGHRDDAIRTPPAPSPSTGDAG